MKSPLILLLLALTGCNSILGIGPPHVADDAGVRGDARGSTDAAADGPTSNICTTDTSHLDDGCQLAP